MKDVSPSAEPYSVGATVKIHLAPQDPDSEYHGITAEIVEVKTSGREHPEPIETDTYEYRVRDIVTGKELGPHFHHSDLLPHE